MTRITVNHLLKHYTKSMREVTKQALNSLLNYTELVLHNMLHIRKRRLGKIYKINGAGKYKVFRETYRSDIYTPNEVVLVVGFKLKMIGSSRIMHWLFQRVCILTTPFWSGFNGFRIKLWMVDPKTKNYLGIYKWNGEGKALIYANTLLKILNILSVRNSVWFKIHHTNFENFLSGRELANTIYKEKYA